MMRALVVCLVTFIAIAAPLFGQGTGEESTSSSAFWMLLPLAVLVVVWLLIWRVFRVGKGGYRKLIADNQERMALIEKHLAAISGQLERIASAVERSGR